MKYEILKKSGVWCVYEKATDKYVAKFDLPHKAELVCKTLNKMHTGFDGVSPDFFTRIANTEFTT